MAVRTGTVRFENHDGAEAQRCKLREGSATVTIATDRVSVTYWAKLRERAAGPDILELEKWGGQRTTYTVVCAEPRWTCDCEDFRRVHAGGQTECKHGRGLRALLRSVGL